MIKQAYCARHRGARPGGRAAHVSAPCSASRRSRSHSDMGCVGAGVAAPLHGRGALRHWASWRLRDPNRPLPRSEPRGRHSTPPGSSSKRLARQGEGPFLLGFLVDDIDKHIANLRPHGVRFLNEGKRFGNMVGRNIVVDPRTTFGMTVYFGAARSKTRTSGGLPPTPPGTGRDVKISTRPAPTWWAPAVYDLEAAIPRLRTTCSGSKVFP